MCKELKYSSLWIKTALLVAEMSYCKRKQVGCVIVKDNDILSLGWNGTPSNHNNCCEDKSTGLTLPIVIHAEENALKKLNYKAREAIVYTTLQPCLNCSRLLVKAGIKKLYYRDKYSDSRGLELLAANNIEVFEI